MRTIKRLKPCVHGGEVWDVAAETGRRIEDLADFSANVNPLGASPRAVEAMRNAMGRLGFYPDSNSTALRDAIARHHDVGRDNIVVGNGSTELVYLFADAFLRDGGVAVVAAPSFGEYERAVARAGGVVRFVALSDEFRLLPEAFKGALAGAKAVFLCNPNNPTGILEPRERVVEVVEAAREAGVLVFLDEDFIEFTSDEQSASLVGEVERFGNLFVLRTFTKFYGLTGLRVGYGVGSQGIVDALCGLKMPWNVNTLAQEAAVAALADERHNRGTREVVRVERLFLQGELAGLRGFRVYPADANYLFVDVRRSGFTAAELRERMLARGVLIRDCSSFHGLDGFYVRVAVRTHSENSRLLGAFREVLGA